MEKKYGPKTEIKKDEMSHVWKERLIQTQARLKLAPLGTHAIAISGCQCRTPTKDEGDTGYRQKYQNYIGCPP